MYQPIIRPFIRLFTKQAFISRHVTMRQQMFIQIRVTDETMVANMALVRFVTFVHGYVVFIDGD